MQTVLTDHNAHLSHAMCTFIGTEAPACTANSREYWYSTGEWQESADEYFVIAPQTHDPLPPGHNTSASTSTTRDVDKQQKLSGTVIPAEPYSSTTCTGLPHPN